MIEEATFQVILFKSVSYALHAEKILQKEGIKFKLIPVPRSISSDCGVCIRFATEHRKQIEETLIDKVDISGIRPI